VTSFQGFQTKPVIAQALFQCTQDHEEYLQAYVRRFLRLRAQAPTVPNEIVIEDMIKGLRPGPTAQYFTRKPPQRSIHNSTQSDDRGSQLQRPQYTSQSSGQQQSSFRPLAPRGRGARASEEDMGISPGRSTTYFVVKTRATLQECAKSPSKSRRRSQKPKPGKVNRSRSCTLLRVTHPTYQNMWVIILQLLLLWLVSHRLLGRSFHLRHHYNLPIHEVSSQKGANRPIINEISGRNTKLTQSTVLCQNQNTSIERYPTSKTFLHSLSFSF
jgi:hypothetical protein